MSQTCRPSINCDTSTVTAVSERKSGSIRCSASARRRSHRGAFSGSKCACVRSPDETSVPTSIDDPPVCAVPRLPEGRGRLASTGTDNADPDLALCLARKSTQPRNSVRDDARHARDTTEPQAIVNATTYGDSEHVKAHCGAGWETAEESPPRGIEPLLPA